MGSDPIPAQRWWHSPVPGDWDSSVEAVTWNAFFVLEPRQDVPSGCTGLDEVLGRAFKEQSGHQLPLHCFVNLSLETKFLALCLDFCWPEQAISKAFSAVKGYSSPCFCVPWIFSLKGLNIRNGLMSGFFHSSHSYLKRYLHCPRAPRSSGANDSEALWWCQEGFHRTVLPKYESESTGQELARCRRLSKVRSVITPDFLFQLWIYRTLRGDYCELLHRAKGHRWGAPFFAFSGFPCNVLSNAGNFWSSLLISFFLCHSSAFLLPFPG